MGEAGLRVSDADREQVARRLAEAHGEGRLTLAEFDERVRAAHGAVVRADLEPLLADLPVVASGRVRTPAGAGARPGEEGSRRRPAPVSFAMPPTSFAGPCGGGDLRAAAAVWAFVSVVNVLIWLAVVVGTGALVHPWWVWVAGPWGVVVLARAAVQRAGRSAGSLPVSGG